ncbi:hypothetical protein HWB81_gp05 [Bacillus phage Wes44]|uniref:Uncharacterized protein n=1 Tax=Bacillus phage Wes44 TaxID=2283012 RepID=A0A346FK09_9CAUD|nr:hypothetical protein HWB81_gp05 [Bacillus phage Wes44]AXN58314.1 hypothetical protein Wes44_5 [Bacillus phage Wes44]
MLKNDALQTALHGSAQTYQVFFIYCSVVVLFIIESKKVIKVYKVINKI